MKEAPIQFRIVADRWPVEFRSLAQGKTTILLEHINYFDAIARRCRCIPLLLRGSLLLFQPFIVLFLGNERYGMANRVCSAAIPCPGVSYKGKDGSLRPFQLGVPFLDKTVNLAMNRDTVVW